VYEKKQYREPRQTMFVCSVRP